MARTDRQAGISNRFVREMENRIRAQTRRDSAQGDAGTGAAGARNGPGQPTAGVDFRRKMSDHIAYALLVYTALQIFVTIGALKASGESLLPYLALIILVVAIIPACRRFEARWNRLTDEQAHDPAMQPVYRRDLMALWALAIGLPFALTALFKGLALVVG